MNLIVVRPDLHHKVSGEELLLVAVENKKGESGKEWRTKWKVQYLMTRQWLTQWLRMHSDRLPKSSRRKGSNLRLWHQIGRTPDNVPFHGVKSENLDRLKGSKV